MNNVKDLPIRPATRPPIDPDATLHRHATAMAEIKTMRDNYEAMLTEVSESRRTIDRLTNKNELLETALADERQTGRIYQRKLIRLAEAMSMLGKLSADADVILRDAKEFIEAEESAKKNSNSIVDKLAEAIGAKPEA